MLLQTTHLVSALWRKRTVGIHSPPQVHKLLTRLIMCVPEGASQTNEVVLQACSMVSHLLTHMCHVLTFQRSHLQVVRVEAMVLRSVCWVDWAHWGNQSVLRTSSSDPAGWMFTPLQTYIDQPSAGLDPVCCVSAFCVWGVGQGWPAL